MPSARRIGGATLVLVVVGLLATWSGLVAPTVDAAVFALAAVPLLLYVSLRHPEAVFALFLFSGAFTVGEFIEIDVGYLLGFVLLVRVLFEVVDHGMSRPSLAMWLFVLLAAIVLVGVTYTQAPEYGVQKGLRFASLGLLAFMAAPVLLRTERSVERFIWAVVGIGVLLAVTAIILTVVFGRTVSGGRFASFGGGPITLARASGMAIIGLVSLALRKKSARYMAVFLVPTCIWAILGSSSRGPILALVLAFFVVIIDRLSTSGTRISNILAAVALFVGVAWGVMQVLPEIVVKRFTLLLQGGEASVGLRVTALEMAGDLFVRHPVVGIGTGSFAAHHFLQYPHNLPVELAVENGVVAVALVVGVVGLGAVSAWSWVRWEWGPAATFVLAGITFTLFNSFVSGDINDNLMLYALLSVAASWWVARDARCPVSATEASHE